MLNDKDVNATIAVKDLPAARKFYEEVLELKPEEVMGEGGVTYKSGHSNVLVYVSRYAGTNQATAATWNIDDLEGTVKELQAKGVEFEKYDDLPETTRKGAVHYSGDLSLAWLKDPSGNILALASTNDR